MEPIIANHAHLDKSARELGISVSYRGIGGYSRSVPIETIEKLLRAIRLDTVPERLISGVRKDLHEILPQISYKCFNPRWLDRTKVWGLSLQMYELRSHRNWGIGDFADLDAVCQIAAENGADFVGVSPLHALFSAQPSRCSPYSPSSRAFLNPVHIAVDKAPGYHHDDSLDEAVEAARLTNEVDYDLVQSIKSNALRKTWQRWRRESDSRDRYSQHAFRAYLADEGEMLRRHALFEVLSHHMVAKGRGAGWRSWPEELQNPDHPLVESFRSRREADLEFQAWLQWVAHLQLMEVSDRARKYGLRLGLYLDFAVGLSPDGSSTWSNPRAYLEGFEIGAPPDPFSINGQKWGLAVPSPVSSDQESGSITDIKRMMKYAGIIRLDHVMGLWRLFVVPTGRPTADGTYLHYPFAEILDAIAKESLRNKTMVVGEDLGNVPEGFREALTQAGIQGYRVLYFEPPVGEASRTDPISPHTLFCLSTHDLMPLAGWWRENDIALRYTLGLLDPAGMKIEHDSRIILKSALIRHLFGEDLDDDNLAKGDLINQAIHRYAAGVSSKLLAVRLSDLLGDAEPTNVPGTDDSYPNWRRKAPLALEQWSENELFNLIVEGVSELRPRETGALR